MCFPGGCSTMVSVRTTSSSRTPLPRVRVPVSLRARFLLWRLRHLLVALLILALAIQSRASTPSDPPRSSAGFPTAATDLPLGTVLDDALIVFPAEGPPPKAANREPAPTTDIVGQVLLVPVAQGALITESMVAPSLAAVFASEGEVLTSANLGNPEVLAYAVPGHHLDIYAHLEGGAQRIVHNGRVIALPGRGGEEDRSNTPWGTASSSTTFTGSSSTVLLAVTEQEASLLATIPTWDSSLMAVLVD